MSPSPPSGKGPADTVQDEPTDTVQGEPADDAGTLPGPEVEVSPHPPHPWWAHVVVTVLWAASVAASTAIHAPTGLLRLAIGLHVVGVVVALGPIILMDWYALVWISGLRRFHDVIRLAEAAHPVIWLGTGLLLVTGAFLAPNLHSPLSWLKLAAVLVLLHNGVTVRELGRRLIRLRGPKSPHDIHSTLRWPMLSLFAVSQLCWWTAVVIGLAASFGRHGP
ncbi:MAG: hypothetical protein ABI131_04325 [Nostocoides sp.]